VQKGAQLFFNLGTEVRKREVSRLLTWLLCAKGNKNLPTYLYSVPYEHVAVCSWLSSHLRGGKGCHLITMHLA